MPFYLNITEAVDVQNNPDNMNKVNNMDTVHEVAGKDFKSVLIVPCRFCPAASMAVRSKEPYLQLSRRFLKTAAYERLITKVKASFEKRGIKTSVFKSNLLHQFVLCMWTARRRKRLLECAKSYEAVVVMGCEAAVDTVRNTLESTTCQVIPGMKSEGIMSIQPRFSLPCDISLELESITPYIYSDPQCRP